MKPIHVRLRKDFCSDSSPAITPETRYVTLDVNDLDGNGDMGAGDVLVVRENGPDGVEYWADAYALSADDVASPENFRELLSDSFARRGIDRRIALRADRFGTADRLVFIAPPVHDSDDPEIQATFDLSDE